MVIDHIEQLELADDVVRQQANALNALHYLGQGLFFLAGQVAVIEAGVAAKLDPKKVHTIWTANPGNHPALANAPLGFVACAFHWYAVSACNYVRLVGWLAHEQDPRAALKYLERVLPEVKTWRDQVASHFALANPKTTGTRRDNLADLVKSVMFPVEFNDAAFRTSSLTLGIATGDESSSSQWNMLWGLTGTHGDLCRRYWPDDNLESRRASVISL